MKEGTVATVGIETVMVEAKAIIVSKRINSEVITGMKASENTVRAS